MGLKNLTFLIFCAFFWLKNESEAQIATCGDENVSSPSGRFYYSCVLNTKQIQSNDQVTRIEKYHEFGYNDDAVVYLLIGDGNILKTFTSIFCQKFPNLEKIRAEDAEIEIINDDSLTDCKELSNLLLNSNNISEIRPKIFQSQEKLVKLLLHRNRIKFLYLDSFDGLQNLVHLILNDNQITDLPVGVFAPLRSLRVLGLSGNKLTTIHSDSFGVHNRLKYVSLADNKINAIHEKFIDNTAAFELNMTSNICSQDHLRDTNKAEIKLNLKNCFKNYQPRPRANAFTTTASAACLAPPEMTSCGKAVMPVANIIGGTQIQRGEFPWIAALVRLNGQFFCGGTLVSSRKVITAAHCIKDKGRIQPLLASELLVILGFHDLSNHFEVGKSYNAVQKIYICLDWSPHTYSYDADIAVLVLDREVVFNDFIRPICMANSDSNIVGMTEGLVVGNGKAGEAEEYENIPKILKMPIQDDDHCLEKDSIFKQLSTGRTFCAGKGNGNGVCSGDSGSGFVVKYGNKFYLRGVVSVSLGDPMLGCDVNSYAVFTDAFKFFDWINSIATDQV